MNGLLFVIDQLGGEVATLRERNAQLENALMAAQAQVAQLLAEAHAATPDESEGDRMTVKVAPMTMNDLELVAEFEAAPRLGGQEWTEVCPVCRERTAEPMFENVFCHTCNQFIPKEHA